MSPSRATWTHRASIETSAEPAAIWSVFARVDGWPAWNAGIASIALDGPFASGSTFTMQLPDGPQLVSTLVDVAEDERFTDVTLVEGERGTTRVVVHHLIEVGTHGTRIVFATEVEGPDADTIGPLAAGDFTDVLVALKAHVERA